MSFGGPEFVLIIIGMAMFSGVLKSWGKSAHGDEGRRGKRGRRGMVETAGETAETTRLRSENAQLRDRLEMHEDRLIVLEKIVTDSGFDVAHQIEMLRDPAPRLGTSRDRAAS